MNDITKASEEAEFNNSVSKALISARGAIGDVMLKYSDDPMAALLAIALATAELSNIVSALAYVDSSAAQAASMLTSLCQDMQSHGADNYQSRQAEIQATVRALIQDGVNA